MEKPLLAGEDFSYYGGNIPAVFFFTGAGNKDKKQSWHNCRFDIDEDALPYGAAVLALSAAAIASMPKI
jgi:amidohydrolase